MRLHVAQLDGEASAKASSVVDVRDDKHIDVGGLISNEPVNDGPSDKGVVVLTFRDKVSIDQLSDLNTWAAAWDWIFKTFSRLAHEAAESPQLVDVQRASVIIFVGTTIASIGALALAFERVMSGIEKGASARKLAAEARKINLSSLSESIPKELEKAADSEIRISIDIAAKDLLRTYDWAVGQDRNELEGQLRKAIGDISQFVSDGGGVEFRLPAAAAKDGVALEQARATQRRVAETMGRVAQVAEELQRIRQLPENTAGTPSDTARDAEEDQSKQP